jgi:hypothetical protein
MVREFNLFVVFSGLPLVGLGSFAMQTSIGVNDLYYYNLADRQNILEDT